MRSHPFPRVSLYRGTPSESILTLFAALALGWGCACIPKPATNPAVIDPTPPSTGRLTVERIFGGDEFETERFAEIVEFDDGTGFWVAQASGSDSKGKDLVQYFSATGDEEIFVSASQLVPEGKNVPLTIDEFAVSPNRQHVLIFTNTKRVWRKATRGDYWIFDRQNKTLTQLGAEAEPSTLMFAKFSPDGKRVGYVHHNNLYVEELPGGKVLQLTHDGSDEVINGTFDWAYEEEFGKRVGYHFSPDGRQIAYWQLNTSAVGKYHLINTTDTQYPTLKTFAYPKVGTANSACRIGVIDVAGGPTTWMKLPAEASRFYLPHMSWIPGSPSLLIQQLNRRQDRNRLFLADANSGDAREIYLERDDRWLEVRAIDHFLGDQNRFLWLSERDGWQHAYAVDGASGTDVLLTSEAYDVIRIAGVDLGRGLFYFIASPDSPAERYLYRAQLDGTGRAQRVTPENTPGSHHYQLSRNGAWAIHTYSSKKSPPVVELIQLPEHNVVRTLVDNQRLREKLVTIGHRPPELIQLDIGGDVQLDAFRLKPHDFDSTKKYPVFVYLYGEPAGQVVRNSWGGTRDLWLQLLAQRGYLVLAVDNRGTAAPRGRVWRKAAYANIGISTAADQAAAIRVITAWGYVDSTRIAVHGWSGGGSLALNLIFQYPDLFQTCLAVAPVADLRLYDSHYMERYMGPLEQNEQAYIDGSAITHAHRLQGNLLLVHGTGDDNVHYQGTERLINRLIEHNKSFTMMAYPNRAHGIREGENTTVHIRSLLTDYLIAHMPPGGR